MVYKNFFKRNYCREFGSLLKPFHLNHFCFWPKNFNFAIQERGKNFGLFRGIKSTATGCRRTN